MKLTRVVAVLGEPLVQVTVPRVAVTVRRTNMKG